jgi:O-antigen ligase
MVEQVAERGQTSNHLPLRLPFVDTSPLWDVRWLLVLLPVWWLLGMEQFIWVVGFGWAAVKSAYRRGGCLVWLSPQRWFLAFLFVYLISGLFIVESFRYITFVRNFSAYLAAFFLLLVIVNEVRSWREIKVVGQAALIAVGASALLGLFGMLHIWRPSFTSAIGQVMPAWIADTDYGARIAARSIGQWGWFLGLGRYFRLSGFFLFATSYASALVFVFPFFVFCWRRQRGLKRLWIVFFLILLGMNLLFTTARVSFVALLGGLTYFLFYASVRRRLWRGTAVFAILLLIGGILLTVLAESWHGDGATVIEQAQQSVDTFLRARGGGSFDDRFRVYEHTLRGVGQRPLFGWGTERDFANFPYPAGSHNEYLAILYRQGGIGFLVFLGMLWSAWRHTHPVPSDDGNKERFLRYGRWFFVIVLINGLGTVPIVDATVYVIQWSFLALLIVAHRTAL